HVRRVIAVCAAPDRAGLPQAVQRRRAIGIGAEQVDEQEHQADDGHHSTRLWARRRRVNVSLVAGGPDGLYAKAVPDDGSDGSSGRIARSNGPPRCATARDSVILIARVDTLRA